MNLRRRETHHKITKNALRDESSQVDDGANLVVFEKRKEEGGINKNNSIRRIVECEWNGVGKNKGETVLIILLVVECAVLGFGERRGRRRGGRRGRRG